MSTMDTLVYYHATCCTHAKLCVVNESPGAGGAHGNELANAAAKEAAQAAAVLYGLRETYPVSTTGGVSGPAAE